MKRVILSLLVLVLFLELSMVLAQSSTNYRLDWFTPLTGGGGGPSGSARAAVNLTVGQTVIGVASSPEYQACLGFWCVRSPYRVYLPLVVRAP